MKLGELHAGVHLPTRHEDMGVHIVTWVRSEEGQGCMVKLSPC